MKRMYRLLFPSDWFSPGFLLSRAVLIALFYAAVSFAGLEKYTTFISGTVEGTSFQTSAFLGMLYMLSHFGFVLLAPIMVIAAGLVAIANRGRRQ